MCVRGNTKKRNLERGGGGGGGSNFLFQKYTIKKRGVRKFSLIIIMFSVSFYHKQENLTRRFN